MKQQKIDEVYRRLAEFSIDLPRDAASLGPEFLRESISLCRNYLNETAHYLQDLLVEESHLAMRLDAEEATYQIRSTELLATDPRVSERPSIADRQAAIDNILREQKQSIIRLQSEIRSLGHVKAVIKNRQTELNGTMSAIRMQRSLLGDMLRLGSFYGDESNVSRGRAAGLDPVDEISTTDLEALVAASEAELALEAPVEKLAPSGADPVDQLGDAEFEALLGDTREPVADASTPIEKKTHARSDVATDAPALAVADMDETEEGLQAALDRFLLEPDDDIASILERL